MMRKDNLHGLSVVGVLGVTQIIAWGSSQYLVAIIADPMGADLGVGSTTIFAAFSLAMLIAALTGPRVGSTIDVIGGRRVLSFSNLIFSAGLVCLATANGAVMLWLAWVVLGIAMGLGLYDAAFAALGRLYGRAARRPITGITLVAGFASTIGWPLTAYIESAFGWREACLFWASAHVLVALPMNMFLIPKASQDRRTEALGASSVDAEADAGKVTMDRRMWLLSLAFASGWMVTAGMAAHLPRILEAGGASSVEAVAAAALVGPGQVAARLLEAFFFARYHPLISVRLAMLAHPLGTVTFLTGGALFAAPFTVLYAAGNGILSIARGTVPLAIFGDKNYGYRLGLIGAPARIAQAAAPLIFGVLIASYGVGVLYVSTALCLVALGAFLALKTTPTA